MFCRNMLFYLSILAKNNTFASVILSKESLGRYIINNGDGVKQVDFIDVKGVKYFLDKKGGPYCIQPFPSDVRR